MSSGGGSSSANQPVLSLDAGTELPFCRFVKALPEADDTIRFFDRKDYHSLHGKDALMCAKEYYKTMTVLKYLGGDENTGLPSVCVNNQMFVSMVKDLLCERKFRVEVYGSSGNKSQWSVTRKGSPGNTQAFEEELFGGEDGTGESAVVMALKLAPDNRIGVCAVDTIQRTLMICELIDSTQYSGLESMLIQLHVKECLAEKAVFAAEHTRVRDVLSRCNVVTTERKPADYKLGNIEQDLTRLLGTLNNNLNDVELKLAMGATACVIGYLELLGDSANFGRYTMQVFNPDIYMKLDAAAVVALNLVPQPNDGHKSMSVYGHLNKCRTKMGQRTLMRYIRQPLRHPQDIEKRLDLVGALMEDAPLMHSLMHDHLKRIGDLTWIEKKFLRGKANLKDCVSLYQDVLRLPAIYDRLSMCTSEKADKVVETFAKPLEGCIGDFQNLVTMIETTIDLEQVADHEYLITPNFHEDLKVLKGNKDRLLADINAQARRIGDSMGMELGGKLKLERNAQIGCYLKIARKEEKMIRNKKEYIVIETRKDGVRFTTSTLKQLANSYADQARKYEEIQTELSKRAITIVASYMPVVHRASITLSHLDVLLSFAYVSASAPIVYSRPNIHSKGDGDLVLKGARHPCLEALDTMAFIPNDVSLKRKESLFSIITGPNMGGKSTYIRMVGVIVHMAQIGCYVPCTCADIPLVDCILARVGAGDSQLRGVSTFMAEMLETASILKSATRDSLIIIDELGRGTSTYDGFGLAWAISDYIARSIECPCLFATHFHELTALSESIPHVANLHVSAHTTMNSITMLYKVHAGPSDQSFGIHVAEMASFPPSVVSHAKRKAAELEDYGVDKEGADRANGMKAIQGFLKEFSSMPLKHMKMDDAKTKLQTMCNSLKTQQNPFLSRMMDLSS